MRVYPSCWCESAINIEEDDSVLDGTICECWDYCRSCSWYGHCDVRGYQVDSVCF